MPFILFLFFELLFLGDMKERGGILRLKLLLANNSGGILFFSFVI